MGNARILARAIIISGFMLGIWCVLDLFLDSEIWMGMKVSQSAIQVEYCEFNHPDRFFHQPINTYSNIVYFFLGLIVLQWGLKDLKSKHNNLENSISRFPAISILAGICLMYLGIGSAFFHASLTYAGQRVDMNGTYGITLVLIAIGLLNVFLKVKSTKQAEKFATIFLILLILAFYFIAPWVSSAVLLPVMFLILLILVLTNYFQYRKQKYLILGAMGFVLLIFAIKIRTLDVQKINCDPYSIWQGHALWHLLTASSSFLTYSFFRFTKK
jgi:uncharacterized membrane protein